MATAPAVIVNLPGYPFNNLASVANVAALRAKSSTGLTDGQDIVTDYLATAGDRGGSIYAWSASSTATDDGIFVIKPTDVAPMSAGRWLAVTPSAHARRPSLPVRRQARPDPVRAA